MVQNKKIAFGISPLGIFLISFQLGIIPMGLKNIRVVPLGVFSFGPLLKGISIYQ